MTEILGSCISFSFCYQELVDKEVMAPLTTFGQREDRIRCELSYYKSVTGKRFTFSACA
jgi:hypothetical protein